MSLKNKYTCCVCVLGRTSGKPGDVLGEIWDLIESVSEGFPTYACPTDLFSKNKVIIYFPNFSHHYKGKSGLIVFTNETKTRFFTVE